MANGKKPYPLYPVVMCGGVGARLWPTSRPSQPKQFAKLFGGRSLFQETIARVAPLAVEGGRLVIVTGADHHSWVVRQLRELGVSADIILEPSARDSAPAMAAASAYIHKRDPGALAAFVACDHYIPDAPAFVSAIQAAAEAAADGRIVTLGVTPDSSSSAYGYIRPKAEGLSEVEAFVEKPSPEKARDYVRAGYLWNSGNFITLVSTLIVAFKDHAPEVYNSAAESLVEPSTRTIRLKPSFLNAPKISIDFAIMEKANDVWVLPVSFRWSDMGAWDAIQNTGVGAAGVSVELDCSNLLVRSAPGMVIAAVGLSNLAIIAEHDAVLVCDLDRTQQVKDVVNMLKSRAPAHVDFPNHQALDLASGARKLAEWLSVRALPLWATLGRDGAGAFQEAISAGGVPQAIAHRRARVQTRQIYVFGRAGALGWGGQWHAIMEAGLEAYYDRYCRADGFYRTLVAPDGSIVDDRALVYDQAFTLLALAEAARSGVQGEDCVIRARRLCEALRSSGEDGLLVEVGERPYQSNPHMHLLEACLAWAAIDPAVCWLDWADELVTAARDRFVQPDGQLLEFFDENWKPAAGASGMIVEPGHQFEWSWLLVRYHAIRTAPDALADAGRLYQAGLRGVSLDDHLALDAIDTQGSILQPTSRLWPQTEWLKASLLLAESLPDEADQYLADAAIALNGLDRYLDDRGLWRDRHLGAGDFDAAPSPASSLYHIIGAFEQLSQSCSRLGIGAARLTL